MSSNIHISLAAEPIHAFGSFAITNSMFTSIIVSILILTFAVLANRSMTASDKPKGLQNVAEFIVESFFHFCHTITGDMRRAQVFMPWVATFFIFIILNNWSGLIPGVGYIFVPVVEPIAVEKPLEHTAETAVAEPHTVTKAPLFRAGTADLNTTLALGLISVFMVQFFGFKFQGFKYLTKYFNFSSPINFFIGFLELISEFGKIVSFGFRLFGNIFAGEVLIGVLMYLTKVVVPVPFYGLEVFVGMIQAVVFSMLSLVLFNMATVGHNEEH